MYDLTTWYRGPKDPSIMGVVNAESCGADLIVRRIPLSDIPTESDEAMSKWLVNLYKEKVNYYIIYILKIKMLLNPFTISG